LYEPTVMARAAAQTSWYRTRDCALGWLDPAL